MLVILLSSLRNGYMYSLAKITDNDEICKTAVFLKQIIDKLNLNV